MLNGKQILITGVVTTDSIAFTVARRAHELGAQVLLTGFPRDIDRTREAAEQLPGGIDVVPFDATDADDTELLDAWATTSPIPWNPADPAPVADATCFLLSDLARAITGEILHVDGGYHAMAAPLRPAQRAPSDE